jgi:hypothetical protein
MVISKFNTPMRILIEHQEDKVFLTLMDPDVITTDDIPDRWERRDPLRLEFTEESFKRFKNILI